MEKYEAPETQLRGYDTEKFCEREKNNPRLSFFKI
jgi:hypothetical protein